MLVAQIVNFGLLMLMLSYFVYKPTIQMIEKNEKALEEGEKAKQVLEKERQSFAELQKKNEAEARERNRESVKELAAMTETIKSRTQDAAKEESAALIEQTRSVLESQKATLENEIARAMKVKFAEDLRGSFDRLVPDPYKPEFQSVLFKIFIDRLNDSDLDRIKDADAQELKTLRETDLDEYEKRLRQKVGTLLFEYTVGVSPHELEEVERIVAEKIGLDARVDVRRNAGLINGFRLEIEGRLIESNISNILTDHV
jgi:F-type H+-transporting ATPase subunit b